MYSGTSTTAPRPNKSINEDEEDPSGGRLSHAQVIESSLITVGYNETIDKDLDYAADVARRAVRKMKEYEKTVNFTHVSEKEKLKAILTLNTIYALEAKFKDEPPTSAGTDGSPL